MKALKYLLLLVPAVLVACGGGVNNTALISGTIENGGGKTLYIDDLNGPQSTRVATVKINNDGTFAYEGKVKQKGFYKLGITPENYVVLVLDSTEHVNITADADSLLLEYKPTNSPENELMAKYYALEMGISSKFDSLSAIFKNYKTTDSTLRGIDSIAKVLDDAYLKIGRNNAVAVKALIDKNPTAFANLYGANMLSPSDYINDLVKIAANLKKAYPQSFQIDNFARRMDNLKRLAPGQPAPEITLLNPAGERVTLSSLKGKLVLLDFWASWCMPCRKENPNVVKLYNRFKDKGFTVYSVSLDNNREAWLKAIKDDGLTWTHVSDLLGWNTPLTAQYNFNSIPTTYLIDRQGNILKQNLRGNALDKFVEDFIAAEQPDTLK